MLLTCDCLSAQISIYLILFSNVHISPAQLFIYLILFSNMHISSIEALMSAGYQWIPHSVRMEFALLETILVSCPYNSYMYFSDMFVETLMLAM